MSISIAEYLKLVSNMLDKAESEQNIHEVLRLLKVLGDTIAEKIVELEKYE